VKSRRRLPKSGQKFRRAFENRLTRNSQESLTYANLETRSLLAGVSNLGEFMPNSGFFSTSQAPTVNIVQVSTNASGNDIVGDAANEPSIAVDPTNHNRMAIGWRQFDTITNNFRQAGVAFTTDGGLTWTPSVLTPGNFRSDPVLDADADGNFFYSSLSSATKAEVFKSTNGGATWGAPINSFGGDKQWLAVDRTSGPGRGNIYQHWNVQFANVANTSFTRSIDSGATYDNPTTGPNPFSKWGTLDVGPDGAVYAAGAALDTNNGHLFAKSTNAQLDGESPTFTSQSINLGGKTTTGAVNPVGLLGQVLVATDHSSTASRGNIYVLGSVDPDGDDPLDVMFIRSTDGGATWSTPVKVNNNPAGQNSYQWFGTMSVAPNGRIDVIWNDTGVDASNNFSALKYAYSYDGGVTWLGNVALTANYNHTLGYPSQNKMGDYYDMVSDNTGVDVAFSATFTGGQDVYYMRITALPANVPPTLNAITNRSINEDAVQQIVNLAGITPGEGESQPLRVTATSNNTTLIPTPTVTYTSPNQTGSVSFRPAANQIGVATLTVTVEDGGPDLNLSTTADNETFSRSFQVTVNPLNDAPVLSNLGGDVTYRENWNLVRLANAARITDVDTSVFNNGTIRGAIESGGQNPDRIWITPSSILSVNGNQLIFNSVVVGTWTGGTSGQPLVVTFNALGSINRVQHVFRSVCFKHDSENPSATSRTVSLRVMDGAGGLATATKTVLVVPVNDAPVMSNIPVSSPYTLNAPVIRIAPAALVTDPDSANFANGVLQLRFTSIADSSNRLFIGGNFSVDASNNVLRNGVIIGRKNVGGGIGTSALQITFTNQATRDIVQELLRGISFRTIGGVSKHARMIEISLGDGDDGSGLAQTRIDVV
jgi:Bacterial Ig domain